MRDFDGIFFLLPRVYSLQRWDRWRHVFENDRTILFKKFKKRKEKKKLQEDLERSG